MMPPHISHPKPPRKINGNPPSSMETRLHGWISTGRCQVWGRPASWERIVRMAACNWTPFTGAAVAYELATHFPDLYACIVAAYGPYSSEVYPSPSTQAGHQT